MANNKLFYTVTENNVNAFLKDPNVENSLCLVKPSGDAFGYIVANGKRYSASATDIADISTDIVDGKLSYYVTKDELQNIGGCTTVNPDENSFSVNGVDYTVNIVNGVLSVNKYVATSISSVSLSTINASKTASGGGTKYVGTSYELTVGIDVTTTSQTLTINVNNTTGNKYKLAVHDGTSYIINDTNFRTTNGNITYDVSNYIMGDVANSTVTGTTTWGTNTHSANTENEKTFSVWLTEEGKTTLTKKTATQTNISSSVTVKGKLPLAFALNTNLIGANIVDLEYGSLQNTIERVMSANKGDRYTIAIPTVPNKYTKVEAKEVESGFPINGFFTKIETGVQKTINGCTSTFDIYSSDARVGSDSVKVIIS